MKLNFFHLLAVLLFLGFFLSTSCSSVINKLPAKEGEANEKIKSEELSAVEMEGIESFDKVMGIEECENEENECIKRRAMEEAHLDYIYTQQHKP